MILGCSRRKIEFQESDFINQRKLQFKNIHKTRWKHWTTTIRAGLAPRMPSSQRRWRTWCLVPHSRAAFPQILSLTWRPGCSSEQSQIRFPTISEAAGPKTMCATWNVCDDTKVVMRMIARTYLWHWNVCLEVGFASFHILVPVHSLARVVLKGNRLVCISPSTLIDRVLDCVHANTWTDCNADDSHFFARFDSQETKLCNLTGLPKFCRENKNRLESLKLLA